MFVASFVVEVDILDCNCIQKRREESTGKLSFTVIICLGFFLVCEVVLLFLWFWFFCLFVCRFLTYMNEK